MKKNLILVASVVMLLTIFIPVSAENFLNFKLTDSETDYKVNGSISYVTKNGGTAYDNCFYLTPTYFSQTGNASFRSMQKGNSDVRTGWLTVSSGSQNVKRSKYYNVTAASAKQYKLQGRRGSVSAGNSITVNGRWTP